MSSSVAAGLWAVFSVALLVGLWAEEAEQRSLGGVGVPWRVPAALGVLRAELVVLLGLMVLLVLQPVSWVPFVVLVVVAAWVGRVRFVQVGRRRRRWWQRTAVGVVLLEVWLVLVAVSQPGTASLDLKFSRACVATFLAYCIFFAGRDLVGQVVGWSERRCRGGRSGEYAGVPEGA
jgi:membrane protein